jgi:hypothetical protein
MLIKLLEKIKENGKLYYREIVYSSLIGISLGLAYIGIRKQIDYFDRSLAIQERLCDILARKK